MQGDGGGPMPAGQRGDGVSFEGVGQPVRFGGRAQADEEVLAQAVGRAFELLDASLVLQQLDRRAGQGAGAGEPAGGIEQFHGVGAAQEEGPPSEQLAEEGIGPQPVAVDPDERVAVAQEGDGEIGGADAGDHGVPFGLRPLSWPR